MDDLAASQRTRGKELAWHACRLVGCKYRSAIRRQHVKLAEIVLQAHKNIPLLSVWLHASHVVPWMQDPIRSQVRMLTEKMLADKECAVTYEGFHCFCQ